MIVIARRGFVEEGFDLRVGKPALLRRALAQTDNVEGVAILARQPDTYVGEFYDASAVNPPPDITAIVGA